MRTINIILLFLVLLLSSCRNPFCPELYDVSKDEIQNRTPEELLQNLERAYTERNINIYKSLLHPDFRFELLASEVSLIGIDMNNDGMRDSWWGYAQEVEYTDRMFNKGSSDGTYPPPDDIKLRLQIPPSERWQNDPEVGHEDWVIIPCNFNLILTYQESNSSINANGIARFYLRPEGRDWKIAIWRDESNI